MTKPLSVLIVGCGRIAGGFDEKRAPEEFALSHAGAYSKRTDVVLAACVDPAVVFFASAPSSVLDWCSKPFTNLIQVSI